MAEYIKKSAVHEILYDCLLHGKSKYTGFFRAWDEIKNWEGVNEPFVRCRNCANGISIAPQDKKFYCQIFNCEVPDKGFCYRGTKKKSSRSEILSIRLWSCKRRCVVLDGHRRTA